MYLSFDLETESHTTFQRKGNPFDPKNYVVARGWKRGDDKRVSWEYYPKHDRTTYLKIDPDITILVGFNIKFDLLWEMCQGNPMLADFYKRGGKIWDCQYVEYLINAQRQEFQMCSLNDTAPRYGGTNKIDAVKEMWDQGILTSDIPEDLLIDYLVGTEEEQRNSGDVGNTEKIFLGQVQKVTELGMLKIIEDRMDGLLATTEMEYNGLKIDMLEAAQRLDVLNAELLEADTLLNSFIPKDLPFEFNWNSPIQSSALVFGGSVKYKQKANYIDEETGELARYKKTEPWPLFNKVPVDPSSPDYGTDSNDPPLWYNIKTGERQDINKGGVNKGQPKFKQMPVLGELKERLTDFIWDFKGHTAPLESWATSREDARGCPVYSLAGEIIGLLGNRELPFTKALGRKQTLDKEVGTYYLRYDKKKGEYVGMLTTVQPWDHFIHHGLNHTSTITSRLSSSKPNLQNLPRTDEDDDGVAKSLVKRMFISRFGKQGKMIEADYSQLEVVVQGVLSGDKNLCQKLNEKVDFHCVRVAAKHHITYEDAVAWCKNGVSLPALEAKGLTGKKERTKCKGFSFQRAYGAGAPTIAEATGMTVPEVEELIKLEDELFPDVARFNADVESECIKSAVPFTALNDAGNWQTFRRGTYVAPTGTRFSWRTYETAGWQKKRGINDAFAVPELKNYPVQGMGGEMVQTILGRLWRHFVSNDNYGGKAFLVNTVHDCVWYDTHEDVTDQVARDIKPIMEQIPEYYNNRYGMNITVPFPVDVEVGTNMNDLGHFHF